MRIDEFTNKVFECDNLELLHKLPDECIDLIYCDVLYGTGIDFGGYQDIAATKQVIEEFYISRVTEMYRVLKSTGSIYLQMDWRISHWIRCMMDDVFGYINILNENIWTYGSGGVSNRWFARKHDNILSYAKNLGCHVFNPQMETRQGFYKYALKDEKGEFIWFSKPSAKNPAGIKSYIKGYMRDVWFKPHINQMAKERTGYPTQKPEAVVELIIEASSNKEDLVADFFSGSGTTGAVCINLGRKYLLCDNSEEAIKITNKRLAKIKKCVNQRFF